MIKSFSLSKEEAYVLEKEAKQQGISQSELVRKLLLHTKSGFQEKRSKQIETLFIKILKIHEQIESQNKLLVKAIKYIIEADELKKEKIIHIAQDNNDYFLIDFLLS